MSVEAERVKMLGRRREKRLQANIFALPTVSRKHYAGTLAARLEESKDVFVLSFPLMSPQDRVELRGSQ